MTTIEVNEVTRELATALRLTIEVQDAEFQVLTHDNQIFSTTSRRELKIFLKGFAAAKLL